MVAPLSSSILRISKWFLENYDCLFLWIRSLTRWPLVTDQGGQDPQDDEDDCLFCGRQLTCGRRGWGEWCPPWSWQWSRPCSPRSKAATMFVFIQYMNIVSLLVLQYACPPHASAGTLPRPHTPPCQGHFRQKILWRNLSTWLQQAAHLWVGSPSEPAYLHISGVRPSLMERG